MHGILHDWSDEPAYRILEMQKRLLISGYSTLFLYEHIVSDVLAHPHVTAYDLIIIIKVIGGERTESCWRDLLKSAGCDAIKIWRSSLAVQSIIEAELGIKSLCQSLYCEITRMDSGGYRVSPQLGWGLVRRRHSNIAEATEYSRDCHVGRASYRGHILLFLAPHSCSSPVAVTEGVQTFADPPTPFFFQRSCTIDSRSSTLRRGSFPRAELHCKPPLACYLASGTRQSFIEHSFVRLIVCVLVYVSSSVCATSERVSTSLLFKPRDFNANTNLEQAISSWYALEVDGLGFQAIDLLSIALHLVFKVKLALFFTQWSLVFLSDLVMVQLQQIKVSIIWPLSWLQISTLQI